MFNDKQNHRMRREEWYECQRCGFNFPRSEVVVQNGLAVCRRTCYDKPGPEPARRALNVPYERPVDPLPEINEDL